MVALYPLAFPKWESAAYFSTSLVTPPEELQLLPMYIPANPFNSLASNMVPAVVLFCVVLGVTLIGMPKKSHLLDTLDVAVQALSKVSRKIAELAPIGVFAISAYAAGTLSVQDLGRLQIYVVSYVAVCLVMALWIMPGLVAALTPLRYREVVGPTRDVLVTAFATGNLFIVLPMLAERSHEVVKRCLESEEDSEEARRLIEVIVPTSFNFPNVGKLLTLTFVLYAGWYTGSDVAVDKLPGFLSMGLFSFFGSIPMAMPFLLDQLMIPADMFDIYLVMNNIVNVRFGTLLSAMHIIVLGVVDERQIKEAVAEMLPDAKLVPITSSRPFLKGEQPELDAIVHSAEAGSAWCLIYPAYSVAVPRDHLFQAPLAYPVARRDARFALFLSQWLELKRMDGTLQKLYDHWILGLTAKTPVERGAIIFDWLGLGDDELEIETEPDR
jgi:Na+/H+-dicarboxylate symporter